MPTVVVAGGILQCTHGGQLKFLSGSTQMTVDNNGVVTSGMEAGLTFGSPTTPVPGMLAPCNAQTPSTPPVFVPCVTNPAAAGLATMLDVGNMPALLSTAIGTTVSGAGPGKWSIGDAGQTKLEAT